MGLFMEHVPIKHLLWFIIWNVG